MKIALLIVTIVSPFFVNAQVNHSFAADNRYSLSTRADQKEFNSQFTKGQTKKFSLYDGTFDEVAVKEILVKLYDKEVQLEKLLGEVQEDPSLYESKKEERKRLEGEKAVLTKELLDLRVELSAKHFENTCTFFPAYASEKSLKRVYSEFDTNGVDATMKKIIGSQFSDKTDKDLVAKSFYHFIYSKSESSVMNEFALYAQGDQAVIYSEVGSGYIRQFRFGLSTVIGTNNIDTIKIDEARKRLLTNGGNMNLNIQYPLFFGSNSFITSLLNANLKFGGDVSLLGSQTKNETGFACLGFDYYMDVKTENREFNFFCNVKGGLYLAFNDYYFENLGLNTGRDIMEFGQINFGVTLFNTFKISAIVPLFAGDGQLLRTPALFGGQVMPFIEK